MQMFLGHVSKAFTRHLSRCSGADVSKPHSYGCSSGTFQVQVVQKFLSQMSEAAPGTLAGASGANIFFLPDLFFIEKKGIGSFYNKLCNWVKQDIQNF